MQQLLVTREGMFHCWRRGEGMLRGRSKRGPVERNFLQKGLLGAICIGNKQNLLTKRSGPLTPPPPPPPPPHLPLILLHHWRQRSFSHIRLGSWHFYALLQEWKLVACSWRHMSEPDLESSPQGMEASCGLVGLQLAPPVRARGPSGLLVMTNRDLRTS